MPNQFKGNRQNFERVDSQKIVKGQAQLDQISKQRTPQTAERLTLLTQIKAEL